MPAVVTVKELTGGSYLVTVTETAVGTTTSVPVDGVPVVGTVLRVQATLTPNGSGATECNPLLSKVTNGAAASITKRVVQSIDPADAAAEIDSCGSAPYVVDEYDAVGLGRLWHQLRPNAGTTNDGVTIYYIKGSW